MEFDPLVLKYTAAILGSLWLIGWERQFVFDYKLRKFRRRWYWNGLLNIAGEE